MLIYMLWYGIMLSHVSSSMVADKPGKTAPFGITWLA